MKSLKVALLQLMPAGSLEANMTKGLQACRDAKSMGADIALFPEMWSSGYTVPQDVAKLAATELINALPGQGTQVDAGDIRQIIESYSKK